jgi:DNA-binding helix-hairpin-helix protein with protein kinase domain
MLSAVQLYHQIALKAHKINDVRPDGVLASEAVRVNLTGTDDFPKGFLGICRIVPEFSGSDYL